MPNQGNTPDTGQSQSQRTPPPMPGEDNSEQDVRDMSKNQDQSIDGPVDESDDVEIGDPVPEDDRTIKADEETGEDEDLPTDDGNVEGSGSEKH